MAPRERRYIVDSVPRCVRVGCNSASRHAARSPRAGRVLRSSATLSRLAWLRLFVNWPVFALVVNHLAFALSVRRRRTTTRRIASGSDAARLCAFAAQLFVFFDTVPKYLRQYNLYPPLDSSIAWLWDAIPLAAIAVRRCALLPGLADDDVGAVDDWPTSATQLVVALGATAADSMLRLRAHPTLVRQLFQVAAAGACAVCRHVAHTNHAPHDNAGSWAACCCRQLVSSCSRWRTSAQR